MIMIGGAVPETEPVDPARISVVCPRCGTKLWAKRAGEWTLANRIIKLLDTGVLAARCPTKDCAEEVPLPMQIQPTAVAVEAPVVRRRRLIS